MGELREMRNFIVRFINWILNSWIGLLVIIYTIIRFGFAIITGKFYSFLDGVVSFFFFIVGNLFILLIIYIIVQVVKGIKK